MEGLIFFSIAVYFFFHLVSRSEMLNGPRQWFIDTFGKTLSYPLSCSFCFSWWVTLAVALFANPGFPLPFIAVTFVPVFNLVLDSLFNKLKQDATVINITNTNPSEVVGLNGWKS